MILLETVTAAPVLDSSNTGSTIRRTRSTKPSHLRRKAGDVRKHEHLRWYGILNATDWSNPCHSAGNVEVTSEVSAPPTTNFTEPTEVKTVIQQLNQTLWAFEAQNTTLWEHFHQQNYTFLPVKPGVSFFIHSNIFTRASCETLEKRLFIKKNYGDQWRLIDLCWVGWIQVHKFIANHE